MSQTPVSWATSTRTIRHYVWKYRKPLSIGLGTLFLIDGLEVVLPLLIKETIDSVVNHGPRFRLLQFAVIYLSISLVQAVGRFFWRYYLIRSGIYAARDHRWKFARHIFGLSSGFFDRARVGDLMSLATNDTLALRRAIGGGLMVMGDAFFYLITIPIAMYILSPKLALLAFAPLLLIPLVVRKMERAVQRRFDAVQNSFSKLSALAQENLGGIRVVRAFAVEDTRIARFMEAGRENTKLNLSLSWAQSLFSPVLDLVMSTSLVILLWIGGPWVVEGALSIGTFVAFQRYIQQLIWPMIAVGHGITLYQRGIASTRRIQEVLDTPTDTPAPKHAVKTKSPEGRIEFKNLTFKYIGAHEPSLRDITLTIEPGEHVALIGRVGAGKSTLLSLLPRLYPVPRGMLTIDGVDSTDWDLGDLRRHAVIVPQEAFLFGDTIEENLRFGGPDATPQELNRSLVHSAIDHEITQMPEGLLTRLGERGSTVSGGQRQRLTLARALVARPRVLLLDDSFSSVDTETEEKILGHLSSLDLKSTRIIAAHRISTLRDSHRIVVLDRGQIVQCGPHTELLKSRHSLYRQLYDQQCLAEEIESYAVHRTTDSISAT